MPKAAFCGLPHSESEVYYVKGTRRNFVVYSVEQNPDKLAASNTTTFERPKPT